MFLPTEKSQPRSSIEEQTILLYGLPKIGKSTFCSHANHALFLATEAGLNNLDVFQIPILNWEQMLDACGTIAAGKHEFKTLVIDTLENAYRFCVEYICTQWKIKHPGDLPMGKGWSLVTSEFTRVLTKLSLLPYGLILVCHAEARKIETRTGSYTKMVPSISGKSAQSVLAMVDIIAYAGLASNVTDDNRETMTRVLYTKPNQFYEAGDRTGRLPETLPLDYAAFAAAFAASTPQAILPDTDTTPTKGHHTK